MYVANMYIGGKYVPGEVLGDEFSDEMIDWLLKTGAIRKIAPARSVEPPKTPPSAQNEQTGPEKTESAQPPAESAQLSAENEQANPEDNADSEEEEDADDEPEPPQIDVMEAIVPVQNAEVSETPKKTGGRKKAK